MAGEPLGELGTGGRRGACLHRGRRRGHGARQTSGDERWSTESTAGRGSYSAGVQVAEGTVFVSGRMFLAAFDASTGEERWRFTTGLRIESRPAVSDGTVYAGSDDTYLYALDAATGEPRWRYKTDGRVSCDPSRDSRYRLRRVRGRDPVRTRRTLGERAVAKGGREHRPSRGGRRPRLRGVRGPVRADDARVHRGGRCRVLVVGRLRSGLREQHRREFRLPVPPRRVSQRSYSETLGALDPKTGDVSWRVSELERTSSPAVPPWRTVRCTPAVWEPRD